MDLAKVAVILDWILPRKGNLRDIRRFLGFVNYYRRFIEGFSKIARPLNNLLRKDAALWDNACTEAFERLKQEVAKEPCLMYFILG